MLKGLDARLDAELSPLVAVAAHRSDLSPVIRRTAVQAIVENASETDLQTLLGLLREPSVATAAASALALLEYDRPRFYSAVKAASALWPSTEEYPAPLVLEQLSGSFE